MFWSVCSISVTHPGPSSTKNPFEREESPSTDGEAGTINPSGSANDPSTTGDTGKTKNMGKSRVAPLNTADLLRQTRQR